MNKEQTMKIPDNIRERSNDFLPQAVVEKIAHEGHSIIRAWREYKNLSLQEMAERMRISPEVCYLFEKPYNRLSDASIKRIAHVLDISIDQLRI
jgi:ribosome-binding protein aMBF1 (putative translation factor)